MLSTCNAFLFYNKYHMYELSDLDIYMQATRISSKSWYTNFTLASLENKNMYQIWLIIWSMMGFTKDCRKASQDFIPHMDVDIDKDMILVYLWT